VLNVSYVSTHLSQKHFSLHLPTLPFIPCSTRTRRKRKELHSKRILNHKCRHTLSSRWSASFPVASHIPPPPRLRAVKVLHPPATSLHLFILPVLFPSPSHTPLDHGVFESSHHRGTSQSLHFTFFPLLPHVPRGPSHSFHTSLHHHHHERDFLFL